MIDHYNAFISYKHAPEDNKVAEAVHKGLERFHIPGKLRKKTGIKKIDRIFRDKDELPITSDLSDTIEHALTNSDYLIVICSTNTKESAWVPREIEFFLKNHTKKDIFTVLVNGEPYDVIPDILKVDEREVTDEKGNVQNVSIPIEPLSCDYRMSPGKAKKTELPRLAAGIIGCAYDELMNRRRKYRLKQVTAVVSLVFAVMLGFCGYMYYSRDKIHKNYLESLKNQSKYLANESSNLLEKERRITALQLALHALPKDDTDDRPVTAEAVRALTDATLAYEGDNGTNINAAWNYQMPNIISYFKISADGKTIAILDEGNVVGVWNTDNHKRSVFLDDLNSKVIGLSFLNDNSLVIWSDNTITCFDVSGGNTLWEYTSTEHTFKSEDTLMITEDTLYICTTGESYLQLNSATGEMKNELQIPEKAGYEDVSIVESKLSPDGKKIALRLMCGWDDYAYGIFDIASKKMEISDIREEMVKDIEWIGNDRLLVASTLVNMAGSMSYGTTDIISSDDSKVECVDGTDLSVKWDADFVCNGVMINSGFEQLGSNSVAYYSGNVISVYDIATGKEQYHSNVNDSVIDVSDVDGDGMPTYITENGGYAIPALSVDEDAVYYTKYFADELRQVAISNGVYVRQHLSSEVIYYGVHVYDEAWSPLSEDSIFPGVLRDKYLDDNCLAVLSDDNGPKLTVFGLGDNEGVSSYDLFGDDTYNYKILGVQGDRVYLGYYNGADYNLISVEVGENEVKNEELFKMATLFENACEMKAGKLVYICDNEKTMLNVYDIAADKSIEAKIPEDLGMADHPPVYYEEENAVYIKGDAEYVYDIDNSTNSKVETPEGWTGAVCFSDNSADGLIAVSDGKRIIFTDKSGKVTNTVSCTGAVPIGMSFSSSGLVVLYNDGDLGLYSKDDWKLQKKMEVSIYHNFNGDVAFEYDNDNNMLYIQMDMLTDVVDMESGIETAHISNCFGHHMARDIFVTDVKESDNAYRVGFYKRYSVKELIDKAHDILKGAELSDEMKSRYGL